MISLINRLSIRKQIWAIAVLLIGGIVADGLFDAHNLRDEMWREKEKETRQFVESGFSVLSHFHDLQLRGELSESQAQRAAVETIRAMRYGGAEYFWLTDLRLPFPTMVMHPTMPELNGRVLEATEFNSASATRLETAGAFTEFTERKNLFAVSVDLVNQHGSGYVTYDWPKPKNDAGVSEARYPKLSYVQKFEPWGWLIGSGVYVDEVDEAVWAQVEHTLIFAAGGGTLLLILASLMTNSITRPLQRTVKAMRQFGLEGGKNVQRIQMDAHGELAELANGFNEMLRQIVERDAVLEQYRNSLEAEVTSRTAKLRESNLYLARELAEHHRAEQLIQESRIRMRTLIDAADESVLLLDPEGTVLTINALGARRVGQTPEDITGKDFFSFMPKDVADRRRALVHQVISTGLPITAQDSRGELFFSNSLYPVKDAHGKTECVAVYSKDVTEQHKAKEVDAIFRKIDSILLKLRTNVESISQIFCDDILPIFSIRAAWIGRAEKDGQIVVVARTDAEESGMLRSFPQEMMRWKDAPTCCPSIANVIRSGQWEILKSDDPQCQLCCAHLPTEEPHSIILMPLTLRGTVWGVLTLYGSDALQFERDQLPQRMEAIATRLGFALESAMQQEWLTLLDTALAGVGNAVFIADTKPNIVWVNRAFTQLSGFSKEEIFGKNPRVLGTKYQDAAFYQQFWKAINAGEIWHGDITNTRPDGSQYTVSQTVTPLQDSEGRVSHYVSILEDITQRRAEEERIKHSANFDLLTDLPNRSLFLDRLGQALALNRREGKPGALMFLDLDHFKEVNDELGHAAGDSLLIEVSNRLRGQVRETDTVARLGGDEFTVILPNLRDEKDAIRVANNIIAALGKPFELGVKLAHIGVSIGIAFFPDDGNTVERVLSAADEAMYLSKGAGRNCFTLAKGSDVSQSNLNEG
ncbi:diguanylate cyclase [Rhodoferax sp. GW822-FHT02A01]|uniref:diguanylate cyclase domain-containing protein n=1 Tax=Rhodoferax sp. GW822-FHT02A01 TaxID=3141537 RepID=UPI00315D91DA